MREEHYALLLLDNMPLKGHFVIAKSIGHMKSDNTDEQLSYTVYKDLIKEEKIYPSSYEVNEFIDSDEYLKHIGNLKWLSRKIISKEEAKRVLEDLERSNLLAYEINIYTAIDKKKQNYEKELERHERVLKKIEHKR